MPTPAPATTDWVPLFNLLGSQSSAPYSTRVYRSTSFSAVNGAYTFVPFDTVRWDNGGQWNVGQPTRLTCVRAGTYLVYANTQFATTAGGNWRLNRITKNGGPILGYGGLGGVTLIASVGPVATAISAVDLVPGDYVEASVYQDTGSAMTIPPSDASNWHSTDFGMVLITGPQGPPGTGIPTPVVNGQWIKGSGGAAIWSAISQQDVPQPLRDYEEQPQSLNDANKALSTGWNRLDPGASNGPDSSTYFHLFTFQMYGNQIRQIAYQMQSDKVYVRRMDTGTWQPWRLTSATPLGQFGGGSWGFNPQVQVGNVTQTLGTGTPVYQNVPLPTAWPNSHLAFFCNVWPNATWAGFGPMRGIGYPVNLANGQVAIDNATSQSCSFFYISFGY